MKMKKPSRLARLGSAALICLCAIVLAHGQDIAGKVTDSQTHAPVANVKVVATEKPALIAFSQADGTFRLTNVPTGYYTLLATSAHFFSGLQSNVTPGQKVELQLIAIKYGIIGPKPYAEVDFATAVTLLPIQKAAGDLTSQYLLLNRLAAIKPGLYQNEANSVEQALKNQPAKLTGTVAVLSGTLVPNVEVKFTNQTTGDVVVTKTDTVGRYTAALFPVGSYKVDVNGKPNGQDTTDLTLRPNLNATKDLVVPPI
jgi:hypothetical protein